MADWNLNVNDAARYGKEIIYLENTYKVVIARHP